MDKLSIKFKHKKNKLMRLLVLCVTFFLTNVAYASDQKPNFDPDMVRGWISENIEHFYKKGDVSAAMVSVVDGSNTYNQAFGYTNHEEQVLAEINETQVVVASIAKPLIGLAILQMIKQRKIYSLADPVNRYFKTFKLPDNDGVQISIYHLLYGQSGLDSSIYGLLKHPKKSNSIRPSELEISTSIPGYRFPAGNNGGNANIEAAILSLLIEELSGVTATTYIHKNILLPLNMRNTQYNYLLNANEKLIGQYERSESDELVAVQHEKDSSYLYITANLCSSTVSDIMKLVDLLLYPESNAKKIALEAKDINVLFEVGGVNRAVFYRKVQDQFYVVKGTYERMLSAFAIDRNRKIGMFYTFSQVNKLPSLTQNNIYKNLLLDIDEWENAKAEMFDVISDKIKNNKSEQQWLEKYLGFYIRSDKHTQYFSDKNTKFFSIFDDDLIAKPIKIYKKNSGQQVVEYYMDDNKLDVLADSFLIDLDEYKFIESGNDVFLSRINKSGIRAKKVSSKTAYYFLDRQKHIWSLMSSAALTVLFFFFMQFNKELLVSVPRILRFSYAAHIFVIALFVYSVFNLYDDSGGIYYVFMNLDFTRIIFLEMLCFLLLIIPLVSLALIVYILLDIHNKAKIMLGWQKLFMLGCASNLVLFIIILTYYNAYSVVYRFV